MVQVLKKLLKKNHKRNLENDINIVYKGLESGEKLNEVVHIGKLNHTEHSRIFISNEKYNIDDFKVILNKIIDCISKDGLNLHKVIKENFPDIRDI